jgi:glycosyltransferase involved in cell wall biosynthesis
VSDAVVELARAEVAVVPILAGSGTRFKILEAWAAGTPVVSTSMGAEGLPGRNGDDLLLADTPAKFHEAVTALLANPSLRRRLAAAGRALFERECTWESAWTRLNF